jgi:hypothetical protein
MEAYNIRGDAKKAKGDTAGALADYQMVGRDASSVSHPNTESTGQLPPNSSSLVLSFDGMVAFHSRVKE